MLGKRVGITTKVEYSSGIPVLKLNLGRNLDVCFF